PIFPFTLLTRRLPPTTIRPLSPLPAWTTPKVALTIRGFSHAAPAQSVRRLATLVAEWTPVDRRRRGRVGVAVYARCQRSAGGGGDGGGYRSAGLPVFPRQGSQPGHGE